MIKKPSVLSTVGIAASIVVVFTLLVPWNGEPAVQAATIIKKLDEQIARSPLFEITLDSLTIDEVYVNGSLQMSRDAIAGDLEVRIQEGCVQEAVEVDLSLGLSGEKGWILLRSLTVPDPQAQAILDVILGPAGETLLLLPESELASELGAEIEGGLAEFRSGELAGVLQALIDSHEDYGATLEEQPDGSILLTLPIKDAEVLASLARLADSAQDKTRTVTRITVTDDEGHPRAYSADDLQRLEEEAQESGRAEVSFEGSRIEVVTKEEEPDIDSDLELIGSTLSVVYDPDTQLVRSFGLHDLGSSGGSISVGIGQGEVDPALLDSTRVTTPNTKTLDLGALEALFD